MQDSTPRCVFLVFFRVGKHLLPILETASRAPISLPTLAFLLKIKINNYFHAFGTGLLIPTPRFRALAIAVRTAAMTRSLWVFGLPGSSDSPALSCLPPAI